jgi:hypothetical protein
MRRIVNALGALVCAGVVVSDGEGGAAQPGLESGGALGEVEHVLSVKLHTRP